MAGCFYGKPSGGGWGMVFTNPDSLVPKELLGVPLYPVQLYEAAGELAVFFILDRLLAKSAQFRKGTVILSYLMLYSFLRFCIESLRGDDRGSFFALLKTKELINLNDYEGKYCLEVWKYNPEILVKRLHNDMKVVDPLSLYLSFKENTDERIEMALEQIIKKYIW